MNGILLALKKEETPFNEVTVVLEQPESEQSESVSRFCSQDYIIEPPVFQEIRIVYEPYAHQKDEPYAHWQPTPNVIKFNGVEYVKRAND